METIGIFGGSFDPPHIEHINLAKAAAKQLGLSKLFIVPAGLPPHKSGTKASSIDRLKMCNLAFEDVPCAEVSDFEARTEDKSYTYKTLEHFSGRFKGAKIYLIIGQDMLYDFPTWKNPERILQLCDLAVVCRKFKNGYDLDKVNGFFDKFPQKIINLPFDCSDLSSTKIRRLTALGEDISKYVTKDVLNYIDDNKLYADTACEYVKKNVSEKRYRHTVGVVKLALKYCNAFNVDEAAAFYAALLHDNAKGRENDFDLSKYTDIPQKVVHQYLGALAAERDLKITDPNILNAIKYHTTGRASMTDIEKLIFVCDMLEESRDFEGVEYLRGLLEDNAEKCFLECLKYQYEHLIKKGKEIHALTSEAYEYYFKR